MIDRGPPGYICAGVVGGERRAGGPGRPRCLRAAPAAAGATPFGTPHRPIRTAHAQLSDSYAGGTLRLRHTLMFATPRHARARGAVRSARGHRHAQARGGPRRFTGASRALPRFTPPVAGSPPLPRSPRQPNRLQLVYVHVRRQQSPYALGGTLQRCCVHLRVPHHQCARELCAPSLQQEL